MAKYTPGMTVMFKHQKHVVLRTNLKADGKDALMITPLHKDKPSGDASYIRANTSWDYRWFQLGHGTVVETATVSNTGVFPFSLNGETLKTLLKALN
ncbi:hypothetical protein KCV87_16380 [Actinosynnema pretiosum subsp. pretiosum]|nr:hypothetical protein [Actinosynnema mirum]AXX28169.1 hypothetical protein APASM_0804 [Actinosynnema pretiosum subsp. pretiosum]QUF07458.1 hypothetical protein KCV87_16380 [Actinosynnema pretiosum subsp. pretiosum]